MAGSDKRGQLSSGLLSKGAGALKLASDAAADAEAAGEATQAESGAELLYNKGDASASTFRPSYWSYERRAGEGTEGTNVTPFAAVRAARGSIDAQERAATPAKPHWYSRTLNIAVLSFSTAALLASAAFFVLSLQHQSAVSPSTAAIAPDPTSVGPTPTRVPEQPAAVSALPSTAPIAATPSLPSAPPAVAVSPAKPSAPAPAVTGAGASVEPNTTASPAPTAVPPAPPSIPTATAPPAALSAATPEPSAATPAPKVPPVATQPVAEPAPTPAKVPAEIATAPAASADPPAADTATAASDNSTPLIARGDELRATGDFAAARRFYELAAEEGNAAAARAVGETYDPVVLEEAHALGVRGDALTAASWYRKAIEGGDDTAAQRLLRLMTKPAK